jgi:hypothetical protein
MRPFEYFYIGDKNTSGILKGRSCNAVRQYNKCVRGRNGNMLVEFNTGEKHVVLARLLRKIEKQKSNEALGPVII